LEVRDKSRNLDEAPKRTEAAKCHKEEKNWGQDHLLQPASPSLCRAITKGMGKAMAKGMEEGIKNKHGSPPTAKLVD
jgi:hypothetical protein